MSTLGVITKDPQALMDYAISWASWLPSGDAIGSSQWFVPDGLDYVKDTLVGSVSTVWLAGGTSGLTYTVTCRVSTGQGRVDERSIAVKVEQR